MLGVPVAVWMLALFGPMPVAEALVEYSQFIILLLALFTISGGIHLAGDLPATPRINGAYLGVGALVASFIGTTGAAMLLIRPLLKTNSDRSVKAHTVIFFIFTVANAGGLLTPLGDPPLFLGFLRGVPFTWTFNLFPQWLFVNVLLVATYMALDKVMYQREDPGDVAYDREHTEPLKLMGKINFAFLVVVVLAVAFVPSIDIEAIAHGTGPWTLWVPWRELLMVGALVGSLVLGNSRVRYYLNEFAWGPILEVAALFIGIFLTMIPALKVLAQVAPKLPLNDVTFFVFTGGLSSVLDNAPTYATFFEMAQALQADSSAENLVAGVLPSHLAAISLGAVFLGALTYIGNGPNFMVKAVAEEDGVEMPSFGADMARPHPGGHGLPFRCRAVVGQGHWCRTHCRAAGADLGSGKQQVPYGPTSPLRRVLSGTPTVLFGAPESVTVPGSGWQVGRHDHHESHLPAGGHPQGGARVGPPHRGGRVRGASTG